MSFVHVLGVSFLFVARERRFRRGGVRAPRPRRGPRSSSAPPKAIASRRACSTMLDSPALQDRYIATAQLGITLASLGLGMYGEHALAALLEPYVGRSRSSSGAALAGVIALGLLTLAHIVIGEMVPKGLALQHPEARRRASRPGRCSSRSSCSIRS